MFARLCSARFGSKRRKKYKNAAKPTIQDDTEYLPRTKPANLNSSIPSNEIKVGNGYRNINGEAAAFAIKNDVPEYDQYTFFDCSLRPVQERLSLRQMRKRSTQSDHRPTYEGYPGHSMASKDHNENDHARMNVNKTTVKDYDNYGLVNGFNHANDKYKRDSNSRDFQHSRLKSEPSGLYHHADYYDLNSALQSDTSKQEKSDFQRQGQFYNSEHLYKTKNDRPSMTNIRYQSQNFSKPGHHVYVKEFKPFHKATPAAVSVAKEVFAEDIPRDSHYSNRHSMHVTPSVHQHASSNRSAYKNIGTGRSDGLADGTYQNYRHSHYGGMYGSGSGSGNTERKANTAFVMPMPVRRQLTNDGNMSVLSKTPSVSVGPENEKRPVPRPRTSLRKSHTSTSNNDNRDGVTNTENNLGQNSSSITQNGGIYGSRSCEGVKKLHDTTHFSDNNILHINKTPILSSNGKMCSLDQATRLKPLNMTFVIKEDHLPSKHWTSTDELAVAPGMIITALYKQRDWVCIRRGNTTGFIPVKCIDIEQPIGNVSNTDGNGHSVLADKQVKWQTNKMSSVSKASDVTNIRAARSPKKPALQQRSLSVDAHRRKKTGMNDSGFEDVALKPSSAGKGRVTFKLPGDVITSSSSDAVTLIPGVGIVKPPLEQQDSGTYRIPLGVYYDDTEDITNAGKTQHPTKPNKTETGGQKPDIRSSSYSSNSTDSETESGIAMLNCYDSYTEERLISPSTIDSGVHVQHRPRDNSTKNPYSNQKNYNQCQNNKENEPLSYINHTNSVNINRTSSFTSTTSTVDGFHKNYNGPKMTVLFNYQAQHENDVSVSRRDVVRLLNQDNKDWIWVLKEDGKEGFIPSTYAICFKENNTRGVKTSYL